jgi:pimeloyl-ACP methyl ester carboxylesterase
MPLAADDVIAAHRSSGRAFEAAGVGSFTLDRGDGPPVVCLHGVPASSFLYRKVVPGLAELGLRGVAFDFPGTGLAERPRDFDYTWSGLARWTGEAIDALGIDRCHLVVHDIGGPVGLEWAIGHPDRVLSVTALDTVVDVAGFRRPWMMEPFAYPVVGEAWLAGLRPPMSRWIFRYVGLADRSAVTVPEIDAYFKLLKLGDGGRAFLRIMRGFELTTEKETFFFEGLAMRSYPAQVIWGSDDPALGEVRRRAVLYALGLGAATILPARHFLTEDQAAPVTAAIAKLATG